MDDIYAVGPARQVFEAVHEFTVAVGDGATAADRGLGLVLRPEKLQCYSPGYDLEHCPFRLRLASPQLLGRVPPIAYFEVVASEDCGRR